VNVDLRSGHVAVVVVDVQRLFASVDGPFENVRSGVLVAAINHLLDAARERGIPVIHSRYVLREDGADAGLLAGSRGLDLTMLSPGSEWAAVDDRVTVAASDLDCVHNRPSAFYATDLDAVLRERGVDSLVLAGLSLNNAIAATARDAFARDIPVLIPRQAVDAAPFETEDDIEAGFKALNQWTGEVADLDAVISRLPSPT
jgi:nicotinamidase-related amidase